MKDLTRRLGVGMLLWGGLHVGTAHACAPIEARFGEIMGYRQTNDVMILGHRGYWGKYNPHLNGVPENSQLALHEAHKRCIDGVEFDVKLSKDKVPYAMHDFHLGRTTNIYQYHRVNKYDPYTGPGNFWNNPKVSDMDASAIDALRLLSPDRSKVTDQRVLKLRDIAALYHGSAYSLPIVFDVKDSETVRQTAAAITSILPYAKYKMGMKVNATLYTSSAAFDRDSPNMWAIPVFTTNMLGKIHVENAIRDWYQASAMEINVKQTYGLLYKEKDRVLGAGKKVGVFNAIPDENIYQGTFFKSNGQCCYKLSDLYYTWKDGYRDTRDDRGNLGFLMNERFNLITTDDPNGVAQFFGYKGRRNNHPRSF